MWRLDLVWFGVSGGNWGRSDVLPPQGPPWWQWEGGQGSILTVLHRWGEAQAGAGLEPWGREKAGGGGGLFGRAQGLGVLALTCLSPRQTVEHGFPSQPSALAYDPALRVMAIGTKAGAVKLYPFPR